MLLFHSMTLDYSESLVPQSTLDKKKKKKEKKKNSDSFQNSWGVYTDTVGNADIIVIVSGII